MIMTTCKLDSGLLNEPNLGV